MNALLFSVALMGYFGGVLGHVYYFVSRQGRIFWLTTVLVGLGFAAHSAALGMRFSQLGTLPVTGMYDFLLVFAWVVALAYGAAQLRLRMAHLGLFMVPVALLVLVAAMLQPRGTVVGPPAFESVWLTIHIVMAFLGAAIFVVLFSMGIMYIIQERQVKGKRFGAWFYRLPSLEVLDAGGLWALALGFPVMTLGLVSGLVWAEYARGSYWSWDLGRTLPLVVIWGGYGALLTFRLTAGWRGRKAALFSVAGFVGVLLTYLWHL